MNEPPSTNPRRALRTAQYRAAKLRQGERWRASDAATEEGAGRLLGVTEAARRWEDDPAER